MRNNRCKFSRAIMSTLIVLGLFSLFVEQRPVSSAESRMKNVVANISNNDGTVIKITKTQAKYKKEISVSRDVIGNVVQEYSYFFMPAILVAIDTEEGAATTTEETIIPFEKIEKIDFTWHKGRWAPVEVRIIKHDKNMVRLVNDGVKSLYEELDSQGEVKKQIICQDIRLAGNGYDYLKSFTGKTVGKLGGLAEISISLDESIKSIVFTAE